MKKHMKLILFLLIVFGGIFAVIASALNEYHDKNTWAVLQITIDGAEIEKPAEVVHSTMNRFYLKDL